MNAKSYLVTVVILGGTLLFCGCEKKHSEPENSGYDLSAFKADLALAQHQVAELQGEVMNLQKQITSLKDLIAEQQTSQQALQTDLENTSTIPNEDIEILRAEVKTLSQEIELLRRKLNLLNTQKNAVSAQPKPSQPPKTQKPVQKIEPPKTKTETADKSQAAPAPKKNNHAELAQKLRVAQSYVQSGNWQAAERLLMEIRSINPNYPGIDELNSQIQNVKASFVNPAVPGGPH